MDLNQFIENFAGLFEETEPDTIYANTNFKELEELINSGVKEISLTEDVMSEGNYEDGIIICTDGLIIDGNNHKIDANSLGRIFIVEAKNVTLKNIVFVNGKTNGGGGAIVNYDVNLRIINCCFKNNLTNGGILLRILLLLFVSHAKSESNHRIEYKSRRFLKSSKNTKTVNNAEREPSTTSSVSGSRSLLFRSIFILPPSPRIP